MASTSAKINVIVDGLKQVQALERSLSKITSLTGKINGVSKTSGNAAAVEKKITSLKEAQRASMIRTRSIGDQIQKAEEQGLNVAKARRAINRAARADAKGELLISKQQADAAFRELKAEQEITKEAKRQQQFRSRDVMNKRMGTRSTGRSSGPSALSSGLVSGAFPLLFGQGALGGLAGFGGGFVGTTMGGQMGGFAGGLVATAALQSILSFRDRITDLGNALNPLTADINKLTESLKLAGTQEARRIKFIEETQGKQAALAEVTKSMANIIGQDGVQSLKNFSNNMRSISKSFSSFGLRLQAGFASFFNNILEELRKRFPGTFGQPGTDSTRNITIDQENFNRKINENSNIINARKIIEEELAKKDKLEASNNIRSYGAPPPLLNNMARRGSVMFPSQAEDLIKEERVGTLLDANIEKINKKIKAQQDLINKEEASIENALRESAIKKLDEETINNELKTTTDNIGLLKAKIKGKGEELLIDRQVEKIKKSLLEKGVAESAIVDADIKKKLQQEASLQRQLALVEEIRGLLASGVTDAVMGLIEGTKTLSESLSGIARQLASMFLNRAFGSMFDRIFQAEGGYNRAGSFKAFQYGGVVSSPTLGMIGEGGEPEYVIPSSKMDGAMARYSAGARGGAVIPGGSGTSGTVAGSSGNTIVEYTGPVLNFNEDEYVPKSAVPEIINTAAKRGGESGRAQAFSALKNSRSQRATLGL